MDMNLIVLCGKLAAPPELRRFESGSQLLRSLVTVRSAAPTRRVDVVPVIYWDPADEHEVIDTPAGKRVWVVGSVQRRFWSNEERRHSRLEVIAHHMQLVGKDALAIASTQDGLTAGTSA